MHISQLRVPPFFVVAYYASLRFAQIVLSTEDAHAASMSHLTMDWDEVNPHHICSMSLLSNIQKEGGQHYD